MHGCTDKRLRPSARNKFLRFPRANSFDSRGQITSTPEGKFIRFPRANFFARANFRKHSKGIRFGFLAYFPGGTIEESCTLVAISYKSDSTMRFSSSTFPLQSQAKFVKRLPCNVKLYSMTRFGDRPFFSSPRSHARVAAKLSSQDLGHYL